MQTANQMDFLNELGVKKVIDSQESESQILELLNNGDSIQISNGCIFSGDCLEVMSDLPSESIKFVVTSPPYNIKNSTGNGLKDGRGSKWPKAHLRKGYVDHGDSMPHSEYVEWQRSILTELMRLLQPSGAVF